ncbi:MAG: quinone-dependent dihydroorotate dehydrogenase [Chitinophagaceae bacterium]
MYQLLRRFLFFFPAESVHHFAMNAFRLANRAGLRKLVSPQFQTANKPVELFGLKFSNPVGLGAGFDKNALYLDELKALGFGFVEVGTVTPLPQAGNDQPRLFRLPLDHALINRMGFNNDGVKVVAARLREWREASGEKGMVSREKQQPSPHSPLPTSYSPLIIGGNIGKNKITPNEDAWKDYEICFRELFDCVDYFVVNVSSPNTPGLRELQEKASLQQILSHLQTINLQLAQQFTVLPKPLLLKIAPDLSFEQIDDVIALALEIKLDGLVATNTTISRDGLLTSSAGISSIGAGGLSGSPLKERSTAVVKYISKKSGDRIPIIASGGVFTAADAKEKFDAGARLVQVWTGFIYEGPGIVKNIVTGLADGVN